MAIILPLLVLAGFATPRAAEAAGDKELGAYLSAECSGCHIVAGPPQSGIPMIAGWPEEQFVAVMEAYRSKQRENPVMRAIASRLGPDEISALAAYYRSLEPKP